jgi:coiled-coil domain-containing protein 130
MAERKAVNKYYPPEWEPKHGSINKFMGSHPLRDRARKLGQGIMIIRFEMPFNIWCGGCGEHIGRGVRYNAEKKHIGNYFSTKIWNFRMRCHLCSNWIEINTDPEHCDYVVVSGGRRKIETFEPTDEDQVIQLKDKEEAKKLEEDPFYKLEHATEDKRKATETVPVIERLQKIMEPMYDDYGLSQKLRKKFREEKHEIEKQKKEAEAKGLTLGMRLLPATEDDKKQASMVSFRSSSTLCKVEDRRIADRVRIRSSSIFDPKHNIDESNIKVQAALKRRRIDPGVLRMLKHTNASNNALGFAYVPKNTMTTSSKS